MSKVYCGTYKAYSEGSLRGKWFNLEDYDTKEDFILACRAYHSIEDDPELHFQDWENIPSYFISECSIDEEFWDYMDYEDRHDGGAKEAYVTLFGQWDEGDFEDKFLGKYESDTALAEEYVESMGLLDSMPENLQAYFNFEHFGRDLAFDFSEDNGFYFHQ